MRLVTRADLDGLTAAVLICEMEEVDEIALVHPQDITDRKVPITNDDILANLPYHSSAGMWFDHHAHTVMPTGAFKGAHALEPSVARVIYKHYKAPKLARFAKLVDETDRFDAAKLTIDDVMNPQGEILLGFLIDPRTGLGGDYKDLFISLVKRLRKKSVEEVLKDPDIQMRTTVFRNDDKAFHDFLLKHSTVHDNVVVTDFRDVEHPPFGNRFLVYSVFPDCNVSIRVQWGPGKKFVALNIGHSIFNRTCTIDVGELCRKYGGGGHRGAGACVLLSSAADLAINLIVSTLKTP